MNPGEQRQLQAFVEVLGTHPWGGASFERLVVLDGNPSDGLASGARGAAQRLVADDGERTSVVTRGSEPLVISSAREAVAAALVRRSRHFPGAVPPSTNVGEAHRLWISYVSERVFHQLAGLLEWTPPSSPGEVLDALRAFEARLSVPRSNAAPGFTQQVYVSWLTIARAYASFVGCCDATGDLEAIRQAEALLSRLGTETSSGWHSLARSVRTVFDSPAKRPQDHDLFVSAIAIHPLRQSLAALWTQRIGG